MKVRELTEQIDEIAPFSTSEDWDNTGLLIGDPEQELDTVIMAVDCTPKVLNLAREQGAGAVVVHHPLIFHPVKQVTADQMPFRLIESGIALIACHTNLDKAPGGVDDSLARLAGLRDCVCLDEEGFGRVGSPDFTCTAGELARRMKDRLPNAPVRLYGDPDREIQTLASLCGSGDHDLEAALAAGADCILTGEMKFSTVMDALRADLPVILLGHGESERPGIISLQSMRAARCPDTIFLMDEIDYRLQVL